MKERKKRRGLSAGSWLMLLFTTLVLAAFFWVLPKLSNGIPLNLRAVISAETEASGTKESDPEESTSSGLLIEKVADASGQGGSDAAGTAGNMQQGASGSASGTAGNVQQGASGSASGAAGNTQQGASAGGNAAADSGKQSTSTAQQSNAGLLVTKAEAKSFTVTIGGTLAIETTLRKSAYANESKKYDFTDFLSLLKKEIHADLNLVFWENLLMDDEKYNTVVVPSAAADLLTAAGFDGVAAGFAKAYSKAESGVRETVEALEQRDLLVLGLQAVQPDTAFVMQELDGVKLALLQYCGMVDNDTRKKMKKNDTAWMIPEADAEQMAADIAAARAAGAEVTLVLLNWGKVGSKNPTDAQMKLAQQLADAGADVVVGAGSRVPQRAEWLQSTDGSGRQTLCVYSLGTLLSDERDAINRIANYLLHLTVNVDATGKVSVQATYTPVYTWKYKQDSQYYYRCVAADEPAPDGMSTDQQKSMQKALEAVQTVLKDSPIACRVN